MSETRNPPNDTINGRARSSYRPGIARPSSTLPRTISEIKEEDGLSRRCNSNPLKSSAPISGENEGLNTYPTATVEVRRQRPKLISLLDESKIKVPAEKKEFNTVSPHPLLSSVSQPNLTIKNPPKIMTKTIPTSTQNILTQSNKETDNQTGKNTHNSTEKKIVSDSPIKPDSKKSSIVHSVANDMVLFSKNFRIQLLGATTDKLVEKLLYESDLNYVDIFLLTYRTHLTPMDLLDKLFTLYHFPPPPPDVNFGESGGNYVKNSRLRLANVIKHWCYQYFENDFSSSTALLSSLIKYVNQTFCVSESSLGDSIHKAINARNCALISDKDVVFMFSSKAPFSIVPKSKNVDDFEAEEIARQLCLFEQHQFQSIHPSEFLNINWNKDKQQAPNIIKNIEFFNQLTHWVATSIVTKESEKERVAILRKFIKTTVVLYQNNNFNAAREFLAAFEQSSIHRLSHTWSKCEQQNSKLFTKFNEIKKVLTNSNGNFKLYRKLLKQVNPPCLPYLGQFLSDLAFIEEGNQNFLATEDKREDICNFEKMTKIAQVIQKIMLYQQQKYNFQKVDIIYDYFANGLQYKSEDECWKLSRQIEPKHD